MAMMTLEIGLNLKQGGERLSGEKARMDEQSQRLQNRQMLTMAKLMPPALEPSPGLGRAGVVEHRFGGSGQMSCGMEEIENGNGTVGKAGAIDSPKASSSITEPDNTWCILKCLLARFELEVGNELVDIAQNSNQPAVQ